MSKPDRHTDNKSKLGLVLAAIFWIVLWAVVVHVQGNPLLLAGPAETLQALWQAVVTQDFWQAVGQTSARILATAAVSALLGVGLGLVAAGCNPVRILLSPILQVMKSVPVGCVVVIVLVMSGAAGALIVIVAFVVLPPFYVAALDGWQNRSRESERVLRCAGVSRFRVFLSCTWPSMLPFLLTATKTAVGLAWKAGITAELLCVPLGSIGAAVYASKLTLDMPSLFMWTIVVMTLGWASEKLLLCLLRLTRKSPRWAVALSCWREPSQSSLPLSQSSPPVLQHSLDLSHSSPSSETLAAEEVSFAYGDRLVLSELTLSIAPGERVCLMAPTGSGKTTLISLLVGANKAQKGSVVAPRRLGVVTQKDTLVETLTPLENVQLVCGGYVAKSQLERELAALLPEGTIGRAVEELSGGTRRLVQIARAIYSATQALVMDEPFAGLDDQTNARACEFICAHQENRPLLVATHHSLDARRLDARVVTLDGAGGLSAARM